MATATLYPILIFVGSIALLLFGIIKLKINPFIVLPTVAILTGIASGMPIGKITKALGEGFGSTLGNVGIMVALGIILGNLLASAGATEQIARMFIDSVGAKRIYLAIVITGYLVSIPVFLTAAFIVFMPLLRDLSKRGNIPLVGLVTALVISSLATHCIVIPTPAPIAVMGNLALPVGNFLGLSLLVAIPAALVGLYAAYKLGKIPSMQISSNETHETLDTSAAKPSGGLSLLALLVPILLILIGSLMAEFLHKTHPLNAFFGFIGDKNIAMLLGLGFAVFALKPYFKDSFDALVTSSGADAGLLLLIVGVGGAFGAIIKEAGIAEALVNQLKAMNMPFLWSAFLLAVALRAAQGSSTVAATTTSAILAPMMGSFPENPVMIGLAICCGSICLSLPNDSGFWVISRYSGLTVGQNLRMLSVYSTISGVVGFLMVLLINAFL